MRLRAPQRNCRTEAVSCGQDRPRGAGSDWLLCPAQVDLWNLLVHLLLYAVLSLSCSRHSTRSGSTDRAWGRGTAYMVSKTEPGGDSQAQGHDPGSRQDEGKGERRAQGKNQNADVALPAILGRVWKSTCVLPGCTGV